MHLSVNSPATLLPILLTVFASQVVAAADLVAPPSDAGSPVAVGDPPRPEVRVSAAQSQDAGSPVTIEKLRPEVRASAGAEDAEPRTEVSYDVTDSPGDRDAAPASASAPASGSAADDDDDDAMGPDATVVAAIDSSEYDDLASHVTTEAAAASPWIQKVPPRGRPSEKTAKSLRRLPEDDGGAAPASKSPGDPLSLSRALSNVLNGPAWPAVRTSSKCSEDMRAYHVHSQNFTMWAAKSK